MQDTKIVGRIDRIWSGDTGSDSTPIFEGDTHEFNANGLKMHTLELAIGLGDADDTYHYYIYDSNHELQECTLAELFTATHPDIYNPYKLKDNNK